MKFGHLFEFHKVPEWYSEYVDYSQLRSLIDAFKTMTKEGTARKLKGYYMINNKGQLYCIDFIQNYRDEMNEKDSIEPSESKHRATGTELANSKRRYMSVYNELKVDVKTHQRAPTFSHIGDNENKTNLLENSLEASKSSAKEESKDDSKVFG